MVSASSSKMQGNLADDPSVASLISRRREGLHSLLNDLQSDNPLSVPDRPHPAPPVLHPVQNNVVVEQPAPAPKIVEPEVLAPVSVEAKAPLEEPANKEAPEPQRAPDVRDDLPRDPQSHLSQEMSRSIADSEPRGRGRPLKSKTHKSETSYSLDPDLIKNLRILAAKQQIRLGRTVSTSEIVEKLLVESIALIKDDVILEV